MKMKFKFNGMFGWTENRRKGKEIMKKKRIDGDSLVWLCHKKGRKEQLL